ncbi:DNA polymerase catalytic subunit [Equid alphaherpesvirus 3]|uniref:DNA polymerase n=3 Tax=Equid alphaherpesvirus 3 TaxID=80341 RepID=A0A077B9C0_9ALPH|nr:DNA polymerase catalytic subunit [Equid alphaherpesvirus 3]AIL02947.1 DNA polymerase catalytic subunit [Equid alphaherpesvirus 3]
MAFSSERAGEARRCGFFNPFIGRPGARPGAAAAERAGERPRPPPHSYYTNVSSFKFIAPRCLDEAAPTDRRRGVHVGTLDRPPKVYRDGEERDVLDFPSEGCWPRRVSVWNGRAFRPSDYNPRFERFHVYDLVETVEVAPHDDASRFANLARPSGSVVTLLGMSACGKRVAVHVYGVRHYFYMEKSEVDRVCGVSCEADLVRAMVACAHNSALAAAIGGPSTPADRRGEGGGGGWWGGKHVSADCFRVEVVSYTTVYFFGSRPALYYRVSASSSRLGGFICDNFYPEITKFEGGVDVTTRLLLDNENFTSFGWYRLRPGPGGERVQVRPVDRHATSSDVEINCTADNLEPLPDESAWPDYKLMCFDIECKAGTGNETAFPVATNQEDLVIQISCLLYSLATRRHEHTLLFSLGSCDVPERYAEECVARGEPAPAVLEFDSEYELLLAFLTFLKQYSPEFATGYNIVNFDWAYIVNKLTSVYGLRLDGYGKFNKGGVFKVWDIGTNHFQKRSKVKINGLVSLDMYSVATEKLKLPSYKLDAVVGEVLKERKIDLPYKEIPAYYAGGPEKRGVIGEYCIQDSRLVGKLFFKYLPHLELSAVARLARITLTRAIFDGQQIRVYTCLLKLARERGFILPDNRRRFGGADEDAAPPEDLDAEAENEEREGSEKANGSEGGGDAPAWEAARAASRAGGRSVGYQGAKVLDPLSGFHVHPVVVLDFASLYPSIIQAHNLCFTTLAAEAADVAGLRPGEDYSVFDVGGQRLCFVHSHVRESLLGILLRDWLAMRKAVRARIPSSTPEEAVLLDKQQAAIKVVCNSVYGFTGVANGLLPCLRIAATVTTIGRDMLLGTRDYVHARWATRELLEANFPEARAHRADGPYSVRVVYGDTDSVFIKFVGLTYEGVSELGDAMARQISGDLFKAPIKLECEKTFQKLLLITKKKYIGVINGGKMLMKGVDLVRKNNCSFINSYARHLVDLLLYDEAVAAAAAEATDVPPGEWAGRPLPAGFEKFGRVLAEAHARITAPSLDVREFVMTAELSRPPEAYTNKRLAHLTVYFKLAMRNEELPSVKERIPYVIVAPTEAAEREAGVVNALRGTVPPPQPPSKTGRAPPKRKLLVSDLAEDPAYVAANAVPLNTDYYFSHLIGTIGVTFKALFGNDVKITESLLKRFIPETAGEGSAGAAARLARAGFGALTPATPAEESRQMLNIIFYTLGAAPRRS